MPKRRLDDYRHAVRLLLAAGALLLGAASLIATDHSPLGAVLCQHPDPGPLVRRLPPTRDSLDAFSPPQALKPLAIQPASNSTALPDDRCLEQIGPCDVPDVRYSISYDHGITFAADPSGVDGSHASFLMRVNSSLQLRHTLFESHGPNADENTFSFERLRLTLAGHVYSPSFGYFIQLDGDSDQEAVCDWLDSFVTYDVGHDVFGWRRDRFGVKLGKWKMPFSRSREETGRHLQFTDRATANILFDINRSIGVGLYGKTDVFGRPVHCETAVFNGFKGGGFSTNRGEDLDRNFGCSARCYTDLFGVFGDDGEPDLCWHTTPSLRVGAGAAYSRVDEEGMSEFQRQRVVDSGIPLSDLLPAGVDAYDVSFLTVDAHLKYRGLALIADYYWRYMGLLGDPAVSDLFDHGFLLQTGYFISPKKLELLARWSRIVGDSGTLGAWDQSSDEVAGGVVWYIKGHNVKLVFDATRLNGAPVSSSRLNILPGDAGWLYRTQFQLAF